MVDCDTCMLQHLRKRGGEVLALLVGAGLSGDVFHGGLGDEIDGSFCAGGRGGKKVVAVEGE